MHPQLDGPAQRIVCGDCEWPFQVDCRDDSVSLDLNGTRYRVRPLLWREKLALARFAGLGDTFLKDEFVRLSLADPDTIPRNGEEADVLFELARWFNAPNENASLPFDPTTLARVTVDLCRALGLAPRDFDGRDANEVELMWAALRSESSAGDDASPPALGRQFAAGLESKETTKIMVVPDPVVGRIVDAETESRSVDSSNIDGMSSVASPVEVARKPVEENPPQTPRQRGAERFRVTRLVPGQTPDLPMWQAEPRPVQEQTGFEPPRVEEPMVTEQALEMAVRTAADDDLPAPLRESLDDRRRPARMRTVAEDEVPLPLSPAPTDDAAIRTAARPAAAASRAGAPSLEVDSRTLLATLPRVVREHHLDAIVSERPESPVPDDFAEELSRAAAQMGIDVEV